MSFGISALYSFIPIPGEDEKTAAINESLRQIADSLLNLDYRLNAVRDWLSGEGLPAGTLGADGNIYLRRDGSPGSVLYFKSSGIWAAIA